MSVSLSRRPSSIRSPGTGCSTPGSAPRLSRVSCTSFERRCFGLSTNSHEPVGRKLVGQPLHALAAGRPHLGDLRHGQGTEQREAAHEAKRAAAPPGDQPGLLTDRADPKKELRHFEHQVRNRLALAAHGSAVASSVVAPWPSFTRVPRSLDTYVVNSHNDTHVVIRRRILSSGALPSKRGGVMSTDGQAARLGGGRRHRATAAPLPRRSPARLWWRIGCCLCRLPSGQRPVAAGWSPAR